MISEMSESQVSWIMSGLNVIGEDEKGSIKSRPRFV